MTKDLKSHRIAIVGSGPRGLAVLERLAARICKEITCRQVHIYLIDQVQVGCGRIWRTEQPNWFLMNTVADEVSSFSGPPSSGPARPGAGPSLAQWWSTIDANYPGPNHYAPRSLHGQYMQFVLSSIETALSSANANLYKVTATVIDMEQSNDEYHLILSNSLIIKADRVILVTGHSPPELEGEHKYLADFASKRSELSYLRGDSAADMPLANISSGLPVGILGLGLSFYDVMSALTVGRGGKFIELSNNTLEYIPSGNEPILIAGSRSGLPVLARGRNQKHANYQYEPVIFTATKAKILRQKGPIDFQRDVVPLLLAEVNLVYYESIIRVNYGICAASKFRNEIACCKHNTVSSIINIAEKYGIKNVANLDLDKIAHPFSGRYFPDQHSFQRELLDTLRIDLEHAARGNVDSPLKAALDVIRDIRSIIRTIVDYGGLTPKSHQIDFLNWYVSRSSSLAAGPPRFRIQQVQALIKSRLLCILGPYIKITGDEDRHCFVMSSPQVAFSSIDVNVIIDARIPITNIDKDCAPLTKKLRQRGFWTTFINTSASESFVTGGVAVTPAPFHPIDKNKVPNRQLYVLGIPTEHTRWFMQAGSSRPGFWTDFVADADSIAADALMPAYS